LFCFVFITPEGFTTVVANECLEKARAYLNQVPRDRWLYIPAEGCGVNFRWKHLQTTTTHFFGRWIIVCVIANCQMSVNPYFQYNMLTKNLLFMC